jgi:arylsulfatase A-like enzyme
MGNLLGNVVGTDRPMTYTEWNYVQDGEISVDSRYITTVTTDDALRLAATLPEPWFLLVAYNAPHYPMHVPPEGLHRSPAPASPSEAEMYGLMVESVDLEMARLLDGLGDRRARTDVVFMGDNGSAPVADGGRLDGRHAKGTVGRGGITVPFIVAGPSARYTGETRALVNTTDLFATVLELAGAEGPWPEDAISVVPVLADPQAAPRRYAYSERFTPNGMGPWEEHLVSIQDARYKLVVDTGAVVGFYDHTEDPLESRNLWEEPEARRRLADEIDRLKWALPDRVLVPKLPTQEELEARGIDVSGAL